MSHPRIIEQPHFFIPKNIVDQLDKELSLSQTLFPDAKWSGEPIYLSLGVNDLRLYGVSRGFPRAVEIFYLANVQKLVLMLTADDGRKKMVHGVNDIRPLDVYTALTLCQNPMDHPNDVAFEVHFEVSVRKNESEQAVNLLLNWFFLRETLPDVE